MFLPLAREVQQFLLRLMHLFWLQLIDMLAYVRNKCLFVKHSLFPTIDQYPVIVWNNPTKWEANNSVHLHAAVNWKYANFEEGLGDFLSLVST